MTRTFLRPADERSAGAANLFLLDRVDRACRVRPPTGERAGMNGSQLDLVVAIVVSVVVLAVAARYGVSRRAVIAELERDLDAVGERAEREERAA